MKGQRGFTLIELILVIILLAIISAGFAAGLVPTMRASMMVDTRKEAIQSARMAVDRMMREIRVIRTIATNVPDIQTWTSTDLKFNDMYGKSIEFVRNGAGAPYTLLRYENSVSNTLSGDVQSLSFTYLKKDGSAASAVGEIWRIQISLQVKVGNETVDLRSEVNPGNFI